MSSKVLFFVALIGVIILTEGIAKIEIKSTITTTRLIINYLLNFVLTVDKI